MRVCLISHTAEPAGAERSLLDVVEALTHLGVHCHVIVPNRGDLTRMLEARGVPYSVSYFRPWCWADGAPLWDRFGTKSFAHLAGAIRMARTLRHCKCDIVVTNTSTVCEGAIAARLLGVPHMTYVREFGDPGYGLDFELGLERSIKLLNLLSTRMIFNSHAVAEHFRRVVPAAKARIVYNAVIVPGVSQSGEPAQNERHDEICVCLVVGSILQAKGQEDAIRAVHELARRGRAVRLRLVGAGRADAVTRCMELIDSLSLGAQVELVGQVSDPYPHILSADVVLVCSRREAFSRIPLEAMKLARPVIAAQSGGIPEQVRDGFNGYLYPPGDWMALADKVQALCSDRQAASAMARRAQDWALRTFNAERTGKELLAVLAEIAASPKIVPAAAQGRRNA